MRNKAPWLLVPMTLSLGLDQLSKWGVRQWPLHSRDGLSVVPGLLELVHEENPGAAFSMLADLWFPARMAIFAFFTVAALVLAADLWRKQPSAARWTPLGLGLIVGGALGNAIDRALRGSVTDFVRFYTDIEPIAATLERTLGMHDWPSFNVADAALGVGVVMVLTQQGLELWRGRLAEDEPAG